MDWLTAEEREKLLNGCRRIAHFEDVVSPTAADSMDADYGAELVDEVISALVLRVAATGFSRGWIDSWSRDGRTSKQQYQARYLLSLVEDR